MLSYLCLRGDSNLNYEIRNLASYPLNDRGNLFYNAITF